MHEADESADSGARECTYSYFYTFHHSLAQRASVLFGSGVDKGAERGGYFPQGQDAAHGAGAVRRARFSFRESAGEEAG